MKKLLTSLLGITILLGGVSYKLTDVLQDNEMCNQLIVELEQEFENKTLTPKRGVVFKEIRKNGCPLEVTDDLLLKIQKADNIITDGEHVIFFDRESFNNKKNEYKNMINTTGVKPKLSVNINKKDEINGIVSIILDEIGGCTISDYNRDIHNVYDIILNNKCSNG